MDASNPVRIFRAGTALPDALVERARISFARWNQMTEDVKKRTCILCGKTSNGSRTYNQHQGEAHIGHRCHFPVTDANNQPNICGKTYLGQTLVYHLNQHPISNESTFTDAATGQTKTTYTCAWSGCNTGTVFTNLENLRRHVRRLHQYPAAKAAGDVNYHNPWGGSTNAMNQNSAAGNGSTPGNVTTSMNSATAGNTATSANVSAAVNAATAGNIVPAVNTVPAGSTNGN
ncbi:hypothetical protein BX600DRAFT_442234 [Xylariales sp. PMI_506]|nr:hypothetical protein BX600DRAFT_442234 [Xylariales sp. PMI_506]